MMLVWEIQGEELQFFKLMNQIIQFQVKIDMILYQIGLGELLEQILMLCQMDNWY